MFGAPSSTRASAVTSNVTVVVAGGAGVSTPAVLPAIERLPAASIAFTE